MDLDPTSPSVVHVVFLDENIDYRHGVVFFFELIEALCYIYREKGSWCNIFIVCCYPPTCGVRVVVVVVLLGNKIGGI